MKYKQLMVLLLVMSGQVDSFPDLKAITRTIATGAHTTPRPYRLPDDVFMRYAHQYSMITAITPSVSMLGNGSYETSWSIEYHAYFTQTRDQKELLKRGVFANSPIKTCTPCGAAATTTTNSTSGAGGYSTCIPLPYTGVFRSGYHNSVTTAYCYDANYNGPFRPTSTSTSSLPCCFTIPESCLANSTSATFAPTSGVFRPTNTTTVTSPTSSTSPSPSSIIDSGVATRTTVTSFVTTTTSVTTPLDGAPTTVIMTSTISTTVTTATTDTSSSQVTLTVITVTPTESAIDSPIVTEVPNTIIGCGTASGCGTVDGSGTVFLAPFGYPAVTSSGTVSGCAPTVVGCGRMIATTGKFTGSATIIGCGTGEGTATITGLGTVYPAEFSGRVSYISSGTISGSGRVIGCGVLTGSGVFHINDPYTTTIMPSAKPTVNVYLSYCPPLATNNPLLSIVANATSTSPASLTEIDPILLSDNVHVPYAPSNLTGSYSPGLNTTTNTTTNNTNTTNNLAHPLCHVCPEDAGICCPLNVACGIDGHCPYAALLAAGYIRHGVNVVDMRNSSQALGTSSNTDATVLYPNEVAPGLPGSGNTTAVDDQSTEESQEGTRQEMVKRQMRRVARRGRGMHHGGYL